MRREYILVVACVSWIITDIIIADNLFQWNHSLALWLQGGNQKSSAPIFVIARIITYFGQEWIVGGFVMIGFVFLSNKIQALKVIIYTLLTNYCLAFLKLAYHEPRPYFVFPDLQGIGCDKEFGKPSGHSMVSLVLYYLLFDSFFNNKFTNYSNSFTFISGRREAGNTELAEIVLIKQLLSNKRSVEEELKLAQIFVPEERYLNNKLKMGLFLTLIFLIGWSRIILGVHSFGQVLLGWTYGILCVILYRLKLDQLMEKVLLTTIHKGFVNIQHFRMYTLKLFTVYVCLHAVILITYSLIKDLLSPELAALYMSRVTEKSYCAGINMNPYKLLDKKCFMDSATFSLTFGIVIALIYTKGNYLPEEWSANYSKIHFLKKVGRIVALGISGGIPFLLTNYLLFGDSYTQYFLKANLQMFLVGFSIIKMTPWTLKMLRLDIYGDLLKLESNQNFFDSRFSQNDFINESYK